MTIEQQAIAILRGLVAARNEIHHAPASPVRFTELQAVLRNYHADAEGLLRTVDARNIDDEEG